MHQTKKKFGQNFIKDKNLIHKIINASDLDNKQVIEIGPGMGALTKQIAQRAKDFFAFEIDKDLKPYLELIPNVHVIYDDILKINITHLQNNYNLTDVTLISNLPYYITTPILFLFLEHPIFTKGIFMVQKEVALRLMARPSTKEYNALSVICQYLTKVEKVIDVNKKMFNPVPKVDSIVVKLIKLNNGKNLNFELVKACFAYKRKTLINNLLQKYPIDKNILIKILIDNNIPSDIRAEALSIEQFIKLSALFKDLI